MTRKVEYEDRMSLRSGIEDVLCAAPAAAQPSGVERSEGWFAWDLGLLAPRRQEPSARPQGRLSAEEAARLRRIIEGAIGDIFGVPKSDLSKPSRGKAPVAFARQVAMYVAHVTCGLSLTHVGLIFARDRTTVAHACAVVEDKRDDPIFDSTLELMEWIVPAMVGHGRLPLEAATSDDE